MGPLHKAKNTLVRCFSRTTPRMFRRCNINSKVLALLVGALFGLLKSISHPSSQIGNQIQVNRVPFPLQHNTSSGLNVEERLWQAAKLNKQKMFEKFEQLKKASDAKDLDKFLKVLPDNLSPDEKAQVLKLMRAKNEMLAEGKKPQEQVGNINTKEKDSKKPQDKNSPPVNTTMYLKQDQVVNPHPFKVLLSNPDLCKGDDVFLIVYVHTASDHYKRRAIIRQTWGNVARFPGMRILFVMGYTSNIPTMQSALEFESQTYKDILQEDFEDTYRNLTYKGIAALKWISQNCNNAKYILKTDDDVFVNMYTMMNHFQLLYMAKYRSELILCMVWWKMHALREGKWGIPVEMYPESLYPVYCSGMAYMFTIDVAEKLYKVSPHVRFFWVDDVYVSGMLPRAAGLNHTAMSKTYIGANIMEAFFSHETEWYKYAFSHIGNEDVFLRAWDKVTVRAKDAVIPPPKQLAPGVLADDYEPKEKIAPEEINKQKQQKQQQQQQKQQQAKAAQAKKAAQLASEKKKTEEMFKLLKERALKKQKEMEMGGG